VNKQPPKKPTVTRRAFVAMLGVAAATLATIRGKKRESKPTIWIGHA
jgi:hypothetical protein